MLLVFYIRSQHAVVGVTAARVEPQTLTQTKSTNGRVEPLENFEGHAPIPGVVNKIYVQLGQQVETGQELVRMDDTEARKDLASGGGEPGEQPAGAADTATGRDGGRAGGIDGRH
jgi:HlyD family secretion protein